MLKVPSLNEEDGIFTFMFELKPWAKRVLERREVKELSKVLTTTESIKEFGVKKNKTSKAKSKAKDGGKEFGDEGKSEDEEYCSSSGRESSLNDEPDGKSGEDVCSLRTNSSAKDTKPRIRVEQARGRRLKTLEVLQNYQRGAESSKVMDEPRIELSREVDEPRIEEALRLGSVQFVTAKASRSQVQEELSVSKEFAEHVRVENMASETISREGSKQGFTEDVQVRNNPSKTSGQESKGAKTLRDKVTTEKLPNNKWVYRAVTTDKLKLCLASVGMLEEITRTQFISQQELGGILPRWIGNFSSNLEKLDLSSNSFHGKIPDCLFHLKSLRHLNLGGNDLSGNAHEFYQSLEYLSLPSNKFFDIVGYFQSFALILNNNNLSGEIQPELVALDSLKKLDVSHNKISGEITLTLAGLKSLEIVDLSSNNFSRTLNDVAGCCDDKYGTAAKRVYFGFIRFATIEEARKAISKMNGSHIGGNKIGASLAKYNPRRSYWRKSSPVVHRKSKMEVVTRNNLYEVEGVIEEDKLQVLGNCLMGWCKNFIKIDNLASQMQAKGLAETLAEWFSKVATWSNSLVVESHQVWIVCEGIPFHAWNWGTPMFYSSSKCSDEDVAIEATSLEKVSLRKSAKGVDNLSNEFDEDDIIKSRSVGGGFGLSSSSCLDSGFYSTEGLDHSDLNIVELCVDKSVDPSNGISPRASKDVLMMGLFSSNGLSDDAIQLRENSSAVFPLLGKLRRNRVVKKCKQKKEV
ncbi:hypothetical protein F3Y22_tig00110833pilonHSYRG00320 [Hibiscus syriacus]|uniref:RRM domain-containing protein n=1 Tax=Hibiscus syriacus TaxID=106335 RepID=A0A6A2ZLJ8_HIBSY|nr:hypothetical protein F3Y22_tig00110833pilonHSYRG00320 [Hibiscus syriacus]